MDDSGATGCGIFVIVFMVACFAAWVTHIVVCLSEGLWGFLIAGALAFPIGIAHGFGRWFGLW
jgi:ABC-type nitrate/sulfonate/bicarbonate transport system permease component